MKGHCHGDSGVAGEEGPHREKKGRETGLEGRGSLRLQDVGWEGGVRRREWRGSGRRSRLQLLSAWEHRLGTALPLVELSLMDFLLCHH